jgi:hypothetical protein
MELASPRLASQVSDAEAGDERLAAAHRALPVHGLFDHAATIAGRTR